MPFELASYKARVNQQLNQKVETQFSFSLKRNNTEGPEDENCNCITITGDYFYHLGMANAFHFF